MSFATARAHPPLPSGFEQLYADHYDFVWRCALRLGATPADVEDVVQEAFIVALRRYDVADFGGAARPSTWLFAILRNVLRNHTRGERRRRARIDALAQTTSAYEPDRDDVQAALGVRLLDEFLRGLEPDRREVFVLAELEGLPGPEIARALELNPNTVRSRLRAARQAFHAQFEHEHLHVCEAAANEAAPREARARGLALLGLGDPWAKASAGTKLGRLASPRGLLSVVVGSVVVVAVGLQLSAGVEPRSQAQPRVHEQPPSVSVNLASPASVEPVEPELPLTTEPAIPIEARPRAAAKPSTLDSSEALARLTRARRALLDGDAAACLALVDGDEAWPTALDVRRVALEIGALCSLEQPDRARARATAWLTQHPDAGTAVDLRAACWTDDNTATPSGHQAPR